MEQAQAREREEVVDLVDHVRERDDVLREELGDETAAIATGGLASAIVPFCDQIDDVDPLLTLTGLRLLHERNA